MLTALLAGCATPAAPAATEPPAASPAPTTAAAPTGAPAPTDTASPSPTATLTPIPEPTLPPEQVGGLTGVPKLKELAELDSLARALELEPGQFRLAYRLVQGEGEPRLFAVAIPDPEAASLAAQYPELFGETPLYLLEEGRWRAVGLKDLASLAGIVVGTIVVSAGEPTAPIYRQEFDSGAVNMSWYSRERERNQYKWSWPQAQIEFGRSAGLFLSMQHMF